jgi:hypothetical protein
MKDFSGLWAQAMAAGMAAGNAAAPVPMVVAQADIFGKPLPDAKRYFVPDGVCGFAWVKVRPGNSPFANWGKKKGLLKSAYGGGVQYWVGEFGQSMQRKEAFASAMAKVLSDAGINAYADSRMD